MLKKGNLAKSGPSSLLFYLSHERGKFLTKIVSQAHQSVDVLHPVEISIFGKAIIFSTMVIRRLTTPSKLKYNALFEFSFKMTDPTMW